MDVSKLDLDTDFLCGSTSATYTPTDKRRNQNIAYHDVARVIWQSADGWQYDDSNNTTLPVAITTLVHGQQDISLPTDAQRVHGVEVKNSNGDWQKLKPLDSHDVSVAMPEYLASPGQPLYYDLVGRSCNFYPTPSSAYCTLASGVAFYVDRNITELAVTATTTTPGFATPFHRILSLAAAIDFVKDPQRQQFLVAQKTKLEQGLVRFYARRNIERRSGIRPAARKKWRQYT